MVNNYFMFRKKKSSLFFMVSLLFCHVSTLRAAFGRELRRTHKVQLGKFFAATLSTSASAAASPSCSEPTHVLDPLIICGPSGVGKGTLIENWTKLADGSARFFGFSVSHTTRAPRPGEVHGQHYHFVSMDEMQRLLAADSFLEAAQVHGNWYGTSFRALQDIQNLGKKCLLDLDVQGVRRIKELQEKQEQMLSLGASPNQLLNPFRLQPRFVFIAPPNKETLQMRLMGRGSESPEVIQRRLGNAEAELEYGLEGMSGDRGSRISSNFDAVVVNDDIDEAVREFDQVVRRLYPNEF